MAHTIGQQLRSAREEKGLSIPDLAHSTRIHANYIRALEADDYSGFASITYAKSFLQLYSRHLNVDVSEALSVFQSDPHLNLHGSSLIAEVPERVDDRRGVSAPRRKIRRPRGEKPGGAPIFLGLVLAVLLVAIPTFYFLGYDAETPEEVKEKIVENAKLLPKTIAEKKPKSDGTVNIQENPIAKVEQDKPAPIKKPTETTPPQKPEQEIEKKTPVEVVAIPKQPNANPPKPIVASPIVASPIVDKPEVKKPEEGEASAPADVVAVRRPTPEPVKPAEAPAPAKPEVTEKPVIRAVPIIAKPIVPETERTNEEADTVPNEVVVPEPEPESRGLNFDPGENRFPRRS